MEIDWHLLALSPPGWGGALLKGLATTLQVAGFSYVFGLLIGTIGALGKLYGGPIARDLWGLYTTTVRAIPELVLIVLIYYAGTEMLNSIVMALGYPAIDVSGLIAGIFVISLVQGAYATEVLRGAIKAVPHGELEAARAYGMSPFLTLRRVTLPAMLPNALPGLANLWLITTKDTALLAVVGFTELTMVTRQAGAATRHYLMFFCAAGLLYLMVTLISNQLIGFLERRARRGRVGG